MLHEHTFGADTCRSVGGVFKVLPTELTVQVFAVLLWKFGTSQEVSEASTSAAGTIASAFSYLPDTIHTFLDVELKKLVQWSDFLDWLGRADIVRDSANYVTVFRIVSKYITQKPVWSLCAHCWRPGNQKCWACADDICTGCVRLHRCLTRNRDASPKRS